MAKRPSFQFYPNDWLASTEISLMTPAEEGAYIRLLCHCWKDENCSLPDDDICLAQLSRLGERWLQNGYSLVKACFEPHPTIEGRITNIRLLEERKKQDEWKKKSARGGKKSAVSRWGSNESNDLKNEGWLQNGYNQIVTKGVTKGQPKCNSSSSSSSSSSSKNTTTRDPTTTDDNDQYDSGNGSSSNYQDEVKELERSRNRNAKQLIQQEKQRGGHNEVVACPECGKPMRLIVGRNGPFYKHPRGTALGCDASWHADDFGLAVEQQKLRDQPHKQQFDPPRTRAIAKVCVYCGEPTPPEISGECPECRLKMLEKSYPTRESDPEKEGVLEPEEERQGEHA